MAFSTSFCRFRSITVEQNTFLKGFVKKKFGQRSITFHVIGFRFSPKAMLFKRAILGYFTKYLQQSILKET